MEAGRENTSPRFLGAPRQLLTESSLVNGSTLRRVWAIVFAGQRCSATPPQSSGRISATDSEKVHERPAKSSALYCRSPYG